MISVIIPAYNVEQYIDRCLESVLAQENAEFEAIVVNDGSTDRTAELCRRWASRYGNMVYIEQENRGQGSARNCGIRHARGGWLAFLDADDELVPGALSRLQEAAAGGADIVCYEFYWVGLGRRAGEHIRLADGENWQVSDLVRESTPLLWDKLFRTEFWRREGIVLEDVYGEDMRAVYVLEALCGSFALLREPLVRHYERGGNLSSNPAKVAEIAGTVGETVEEFVRRGLFGQYRMSLFYLVCGQYALYRMTDYCVFGPGQKELLCRELEHILERRFPACYGWLETFRGTEMILIGRRCRPSRGDAEVFRRTAFFPDLEQFLSYYKDSGAEHLLYLVDLVQEDRCLRFGTRTEEWQRERWEALAEEFLSAARGYGRTMGIFVYDGGDGGGRELYRMLTGHEGVCGVPAYTPVLEILAEKGALPGKPGRKEAAGPGRVEPGQGFWSRGEQYRLQLNENILNAWLALKYRGGGLAPFFAERGYSRAAIYGMGHLGERLLEELRAGDISVLYGIDRRGGRTVAGLAVYGPEEELPDADVIVVTVAHQFFGIRHELGRRTDIPAVSLEEVLEASLQVSGAGVPAGKEAGLWD